LESILETLLIYLAIGTLAGITAGLLGLGGGAVIVPALYMVFIAQQMPEQMIMHMAVGTSLATIVFTSLSSIRAHHKRGAVMWPVVKAMSPGIILGTILGTLIANQLSSDDLRIIFGVCEILIALQMGLDVIPEGNHHLPGRFGLFNAGGITGIISALIGIGGGSVTVPFLHWCKVNMRNAVATSSACGFPIAIVATVSYIITGWQETKSLEWSVGFIYLPALLGIIFASVTVAPLGARLAHHLPLLALKKIFALVLALIGIKMLLG
jgi:hypothetical protein